MGRQCGEILTMERIAFLYPGQGSQSQNMGLDIIDAYPIARERYQQAEEILGWSVEALSKPDGAESLNITLFTQPALYTLSCVIGDLLQSNQIHPCCVAGHSAGEYPALTAAEAWDFETGLKVIAERARLMHESRATGMMAAVLGLNNQLIKELCEAWTEGIVQVAGLNSPKQTVITGEKQAIEGLTPLLKEKGAKRVVPLATSNAFHSPLMEEAKIKFSAYLENIEIKTPKVPLISNNTGKPEMDPIRIKEQLVNQFCQPVRWIDCMHVIENDCDRALEVGPGKVLCGLAKACCDDLSCEETDNVETVRKVIEQYGG